MSEETSTTKTLTGSIGADSKRTKKVRINERIEAFWSPEKKGESFTGKLVGRKIIKDQGNESAALVGLVDQYLDSVLTIEFQGKSKLDGGRTYKNFDVFS